MTLLQLVLPVGCIGGDAADSIDAAADAAVVYDGCDEGELEPLTGLCWLGYPSADYDQSSAVDYCAGLATGGHSDWRLPTRDELVGALGTCPEEIADGGFGACRKCSDGYDCYRLFGDDMEFYWSATPFDADYGIYVRFSGGVYVAGKGELFRARCVRNAAEPIPDSDCDCDSTWDGCYDSCVLLACSDGCHFDATDCCDDNLPAGESGCSGAGCWTTEVD
jgi:hypothetical protein